MNKNYIVTRYIGGSLMKKLKICILLILVFLLQGCVFDDPKYINLNDKSSLDLYTKEVYSKLLNNEEYSLEIFDTNFSKNIPVDDNEEIIIENFIRSLSTDNYKEKEEIPTEKEPFQIRIKFNDSKYVFKIYDDKRVTINPWDGVYDEDIIDMENVPKRYNLYDFCTHIQNESKYNQ